MPVNNNKPAAPLASDVVYDELKNGMKVLVKQVYPSSVVNLSVWVRVGAAHEAERISGISHFIEHMLFKGTSKRALGEIAREIHGCGGYMNAFTDYECTCYWVVLPSKYLETALDVQADALLHSLFDADEIRKECEVIIEELKMYEDRPESLAFETLLELAYKKHPYGRPIIGFEKTLRQLIRRDFLDYFQQYYLANNMFVTLIGDVVPTQAVRKIKEAFKNLPSGNIPAGRIENEPAQKEFRQRTRQGDIARSYMQMGFHIPQAVHEDIYPLRVLAALLGSGRSSRLNQTLREKYRWVDDAEAGLFAQKNPGLLYLAVRLDEKNIQASEEMIWKQIEALRESPVSPEELLKAQNIIESDFIFAQETVEGQGRTLGGYELLGDYKLAEKFLPELFMVTAKDIRRTAQKYLTRENCSRVIYHN